MKDLSLLVWLTQLGMSVAVPLAVFIGLAVWLRNAWGWGDWVIFAGFALGVCWAVQGFLSSLRTLERMSADRKEQAPPVSFNDHE